MRETKFKIGSRPWTIEVPYYRGQPVYRIARHDEEIIEVHIVITEEGEKEVPYHKRGDIHGEYFAPELYKTPVFATREEAIEFIREAYRDTIKYIEEQAEFFRKELEELE